MRLVLDTHVLLGLLDQRVVSLPEAFKTLLSKPEVTAIVSAASLWEIAIKHRLGKLALDCPPRDLPRRIAAMPGLSLLAVTPAHTLHEVDPWPSTNDPFDRLLIAISAIENAQLLTFDRDLIDHPLAWRPA